MEEMERVGSTIAAASRTSQPRKGFLLHEANMVPARHIVMSALLVLAACGGRQTAPPEPSPEPATARESDARVERFVGFYEVGWEREVFRPCGVDEEWWSWNTERVIRDDWRGWGRAFVELEGTVSGRGAFGHLGRYPRQIVVTRLIEVRPAEGAACPTGTEIVREPGGPPQAAPGARTRGSGQIASPTARG
jgi:hypothetical protein